MSLGKILVAIYRGFRARRWLLYTLLSALTLLIIITALQIKFTEDPLQLFPTKGEASGSAKLFSKLKVKDKIVVLLSYKEIADNYDTDLLADAAERFRTQIREKGLESFVELTGSTESFNEEEIISFIYENLPIYLDADDYNNIENSTGSDFVKARLDNIMGTLISPAGATAAKFFSVDPLSFGSHLFSNFDMLRMGVKMNHYRENIFSEDWSSLFFTVTPVSTSSDSFSNEKITSAFESIAKSVETEYDNISVALMGAPLAAAYNTRVIKRDTFITTIIALVLIASLFWLAFRNSRTLLILLFPAVFGALFALALMTLKGEPISAIAIGAGAIVLGIALSYSIHVISHIKYVRSVEQLIDELAYPLTVGSFTTIGAFLGLLFTNSSLLQDFGLFSSLTLTGTTIFSLIFLPHFIDREIGAEDTGVYSFIVKVTSFEYDKVKWLKWLIVALFVMGLFFSPGVKFNSDFSKLGYEPAKMVEAQERFSTQFGGGDARVFLLSSAENFSDAAEVYYKDNKILDSLVGVGMADKSSSIAWLFPDIDTQKERIDRWNSFWGDGEKERLIAFINSESAQVGFSEDAFRQFALVLNKDYRPVTYADHYTSLPKFFNEWIERQNEEVIFITQLSTNQERERLYEVLVGETGFDILDRAYFSSVWVESLIMDFDIILFISSILVFATLLISYGRIELAAMAFLPMAVSWVIILGLMSLAGIEFNVFNILLATFVFGIGDDFSIFVLDGLSAEYMGSRDRLHSHKSAIFFSTFTIIAGVGAMAFAAHPALRSIALVSIIGIFSVWLVSYSIQPVVYRFFITNPASKGMHPYTFFGALQMLITFSAFFIGCVILTLLIPLFFLLPVKGKKRVSIFRYIVYKIVFLPVRLSPTVKIFKDNSIGETFKRPAVIVANHQSFIDILMMLSLHPKIVMMTNSWVWNSPIFGHIVRFAGFLNYNDGVDNHIVKLRSKIDDGYSLLIFPEGTRSADLEIHRFHKGAFKIAEELSLDIIPIVIYGNGNLVSKRQPFYVKRGTIGYRILERVSPDDIRFGRGYSERGKMVARYMREEYKLLRELYDSPENRYFSQRVMSGYIYKGPVVEWYIRVKMRMERNYLIFNRLIPAKATIADLGCGYGPLSFMLGTLSPQREVLGVDYDEEKIDIAKSSWLAGGNIKFLVADIVNMNLPPRDVFILSDVLHYLLPEDQETLLTKTISALNRGGFVIVRDANSHIKRGHRFTLLSEWFSIRLLKFNKAQSAPYFTDSTNIRDIAANNNCLVTEFRNDKVTSNTIYVIRPNEVEY